jgi:hypothetical protein
MVDIVSEEDFYNSFNNFQKQRVGDYKKVIELSKKINNKLEVSRRLLIPKSTVQNWVTGKTKPIAIKQAEELKQKGLLPLKKSNDKKFLFFVELLAFLFGDGHLSKNIAVTIFCGGLDDLDEIKHNLLVFFNVNSRITSKESKGKVIKIFGNARIEKEIIGNNNSLWLSSSSINRLFFLAGAPNGDKVKSIVVVPNWIIESNLLIKSRFLGVLFGNELQCPKLRAKMHLLLLN